MYTDFIILYIFIIGTSNLPNFMKNQKPILCHILLKGILIKYVLYEIPIIFPSILIIIFSW